MRKSHVGVHAPDCLPCTRLQTTDSRPVALPVHAIHMEPYLDPIDSPADIGHSLQLLDTDVPTNSFPDIFVSPEPQFTFPEDIQYMIHP